MKSNQTNQNVSIYDDYYAFIDLKHTSHEHSCNLNNLNKLFFQFKQNSQEVDIYVAKFYFFDKGTKINIFIQLNKKYTTIKTKKQYYTFIGHFNSKNMYQLLEYCFVKILCVDTYKTLMVKYVLLWEEIPYDIDVNFQKILANDDTFWKKINSYLPDEELVNKIKEKISKPKFKSYENFRDFLQQIKSD